MRVKVTGGVLENAEKQAYINYIRQKNPDRIIREIEMEVDGDFVNLKTHFADVPFQRIRRITGYLVGTLDRFNDAKRAEVMDRIKNN